MMLSTKRTEQERLKIFVSAYACEPDLGSEIGVGWHWVLEMSKYFELWVLTRESNRHTIEPWMASHPEYARIHWLYYDWPRWVAKTEHSHPVERFNPFTYEPKIGLKSA